ncbi:hypothetical protein KJ603_00555, partial [Patescibacteria group bacterium]|nr:hypothetical protein [Patescibacteria group bacterium]
WAFCVFKQKIPAIKPMAIFNTKNNKAEKIDPIKLNLEKDIQKLFEENLIGSIFSALLFFVLKIAIGFMAGIFCLNTQKAHHQEGALRRTSTKVSLSNRTNDPDDGFFTLVRFLGPYPRL